MKRQKEKREKISKTFSIRDFHDHGYPVNQQYQSINQVSVLSSREYDKITSGKCYIKTKLIDQVKKMVFCCSKTINIILNIVHITTRNGTFKTVKHFNSVTNFLSFSLH